jgi:hypothetical protein
MRKLYESFHIFHFQKRIVSAESKRGNTVHLDRGWNVEIGVEYRMIFVVVFFNVAVNHILGQLQGLEKVG